MVQARVAQKLIHVIFFEFPVSTYIHIYGNYWLMTHIFDNLRMKYTKLNRGRCVQLDAIGASARPDLFHQAMHTVLYRHTATAIEMVDKVDTFCIVVLFAVAWLPPGDTERVVTRCRRLVAFMNALDLLYQAMHFILLQCVRMAIKMARDGGTSVPRRRFFYCCNRSLRPYYGPSK